MAVVGIEPEPTNTKLAYHQDVQYNDN